MKNKELQEKLAQLPDDFDICFDEGDGSLVLVTYVEIFKGGFSGKKVILLSNENPLLGSGGADSDKEKEQVPGIYSGQKGLDW